ncbi:unnamed protein product [Heligmosomoides polygyrus]|uniref:Uncharacterized protein n=1 Tax=Heligmosomoides polygyrus TaxID=6339 RepID=A0A183G9P5_HELPZ|nr:unnamed protein product [Heligmosomoides polygyrus]
MRKKETAVISQYGYQESRLSMKLGRRLPTRYVKLLSRNSALRSRTTPGRQAALAVDKRREGKSFREVALSRVSQRKEANNWREYQEAKKAAKKAVAVAKATHYGDVNEKLESRNGDFWMSSSYNTINVAVYLLLNPSTAMQPRLRIAYATLLLRCHLLYADQRASEDQSNDMNLLPRSSVL